MDSRRIGRRAAAAAVLALVAVPAAVAVPGTPAERLTAADNRRAAKALIRRSDLSPAYRADPRRRAAPMVGRCPGLYLPDRSSVVISGAADSFFTNGSSAISSSSSVFRSAGDADLYWRETVKPNFVLCLTRIYRQEVAPGTTTSPLRVGLLDIGPTGVDRTAAYLTVIRYRDSAGRTSVVTRTVVFVSTGRSLVHLVFAKPGSGCNCSETVRIARTVALRLIDSSHG